MAALAVTTDAQQVQVDADSRVILQNLGTGNVYIGNDDTVTAETGYKMATGAVLTIPTQINEGMGQVWAIGDAAADLRYLEF